MSNESAILSLLGGLEYDDPRLYSLLDLFIQDFYALNNQINPPQVESAGGITGQIQAPDDTSGFIATIYPDNVRLSWNVTAGLRSFEIRYMFGIHDATDWDIASSILRTSTFSADLDPVSIPMIFGDHTFFLKSIDTFGTESTIASVIVVNVPQISAPVITPVIIGNFVLLYWTEPTSLFMIDHYNFYKNGVSQGTIQGTFKTIFETVGGTYTYTIEAVDIVDNIGLMSPDIALVISNPSDFALHAIQTATLTGTFVNTKKENVSGVDYLLADIDITETYQSHFTSHSWASPQDQVDAGYVIYIEPAKTTGSYQEVFDFGTIINNIIVAVTWNVIAISGSISTGTSTIETSTDGSTWGTPIVDNVAFATSLRYIRFKFNFVGTNDKSLSYYYNIQCALNVKREHDGGTVSVLAADTGGTTVTFNKAFKSIDAIDLTPIATVERKAVYDFAFPINPTTFKILLFNAAGARVNGDVSWIARGIL